MCPQGDGGIVLKKIVLRPWRTSAAGLHRADRPEQRKDQPRKTGNQRTGGWTSHFARSPDRQHPWRAPTASALHLTRLTITAGSILTAPQAPPPEIPQHWRLRVARPCGACHHRAGDQNSVHWRPRCGICARAMSWNCRSNLLMWGATAGAENG
jgi:hypothetical protein